MKKQHWLINLSIIGLLWFTLAFACNSGNERGGGTGDGTIRRTSSDTITDDKTTSPMETQTGVGKPYGARDPRTCQATGGSSAPSEGEATNSFICNKEGEVGESLQLVDNVLLQVGRGRSYDPNADMNLYNVDRSAYIYPIRGSFTEHQCLREYDKNKGQNCKVRDNPQAEGLCYKNTWGNWVCTMVDENGKTIREYVAPPR